MTTMAVRRCLYAARAGFQKVDQLRDLSRGVRKACWLANCAPGLLAPVVAVAAGGHERRRGLLATVAERAICLRIHAEHLLIASSCHQRRCAATPSTQVVRLCRLQCAGRRML